MTDSFDVHRDEIAAKVVDGEAVLINLSSGVYYSLQGPGATAWAYLEAGHPLDAVAAQLAARHGAPPARARADVEALVAELRGEGVLVERATAGPPATVDEAELPVADGDYTPPALERYADMGDLLALDPPMPGVADIPWRAPQA
jgi:hypothetical protein